MPHRLILLTLIPFHRCDMRSAVHTILDTLLPLCMSGQSTYLNLLQGKGGATAVIDRLRRGRKKRDYAKGGAHAMEAEP